MRHRAVLQNVRASDAAFTMGIFLAKNSIAPPQPWQVSPLRVVVDALGQAAFPWVRVERQYFSP